MAAQGRPRAHVRAASASPLPLMGRGRGWGEACERRSVIISPPCPLPASRGTRAFGTTEGTAAKAASSELAGRGEHRLLLRHHLDDAVLAVLDVENELAEEGLVVLLAQHLVALREVVAFRHLQTFEGFDQLRGVLAAAEARLLHAEL